jgi:hypothetical protein
MTESQFFRRAAIVSTGLTLVALAVDLVSPHEPAWVLPFGEPWLTVVGSCVLWMSIFIVCHVGRWIYLIIRRGPNLG